MKYLTRYTHETFFEEYINFIFRYLSHCGVGLQPHGLGLKEGKDVEDSRRKENFRHYAFYCTLF
jgi:hypothetical protein